MSIYSIVDITAYLFVICCSLRDNVRCQNRIILWFLIAWTILVSFRGYGVGNDTSGYAYFFSGNIYKSLNLQNYGTIDDPVEELEFGFIFISKFLSIISSSPTFLFTVIAIVFFSGIYHLYRDKNTGAIGLLWLFTSTFSMMNIIYAARQCLSLGFFIWGILLFDRSFIKIGLSSLFSKCNFKNKYFFGGVVFIILSLIVHRTSIFILVIYIIMSYIRIEKVMAYSLVIISSIISLQFFSVWQNYFDLLFLSLDGVSFNDFSVLTRYQDTMEVENVSFLNIISFVLPCIVSIYFATESEIKDKGFKMYITSICLYNLFSSSTYMLRFIVIFFIIGYTSAIPKATSKNKVLQLFYLAITSFNVWKMVNLYANWPTHISSDLPYKFFWE